MEKALAWTIFLSSSLVAVVLSAAAVAEEEGADKAIGVVLEVLEAFIKSFILEEVHLVVEEAAAHLVKDGAMMEKVNNSSNKSSR